MQVTLTGLQHALTPVEASNPGIHVFQEPALFRDALWLPYRRDPGALHSALRAAPEGLAAVFAHADVAGAALNEAYQAREGLPPASFPPGIPVYTGHYHKPHTVPGTNVHYVGSPYQGKSCQCFVVFFGGGGLFVVGVRKAITGAPVHAARDPA